MMTSRREHDSLLFSESCDYLYTNRTSECVAVVKQSVGLVQAANQACKVQSSLQAGSAYLN
ncbi:hypothetical protein KP509_08G060700 [Ceratopteris richardii]|uniref:Uncharacterized protein n=1 Tax=Ceratopteris richardii TaxID=49495 RepID=A0A8T2U776_CERRI|nr:hypothetical protein KP509_08G060700 [Ceratopteris richardii]